MIQEDLNTVNTKNILDSVLVNPLLGIFRISSSGVPVYTNQTFLKFLGFTSFEDLLNKFNIDQNFKNKFNILIHHKNKNSFDFPEAVEVEWLNKNNRVVYLREFVHKVSVGEDYFLDIIAEDITGIKIVDELIKDFKVRDHSILRALPDFLFVLSSEGNFIDYKLNKNPDFFISPVSVISKSVFEIFPHEIAEKTYQHIQKVFEEDNIQTFDFSLEHKNQTNYYEARLVKSLQNEVLLLLRDVTAQKNAEAQIKEITENLRHTNATKDKFFSIIAHDLRTPLIGLIGYAEILSEEIDNLEKTEIKEFSTNIVDISQQTIKLLSNLLEWSRIQTGRIEYNPIRLNAYYAVDNVIRLLISNADHKNIKLINEAAKEHIILADENMLHSVLMNLISNALKFTNEGGIVKVKSDVFKKEMIKLSICDNGIGMDEENMSKLFNLDKTFTTPGTANEKGSGIGTVLCKEFVYKHGGNIWVESEKGIGTTVHFTLPRFAEQNA